MTSFNGEKFGKDIVTAVRGYVDKAIAPLLARIEELENGSNHGDQYKGVHQRAQNYRRGAMVTADGSLWIALVDAPKGITPGTDPATWQLASKGGKPPSTRART